MNQKSIKFRFMVTFATNTVRAVLSFFTGLLIAKALGPSEYGNFNFLLGSFASLSALVDMASSSAFYTFISQRQRGRNFFIYYIIWILIQFLLLIIIVFVLPTSIRHYIWIGHPIGLIFLALLASFAMNQLWRAAAQIGESVRDTLGVQTRNLCVAMVYLICIVLCGRYDFISIKRLFYLNIGLYTLFSLLYFHHIHRDIFFSETRTEYIGQVLGEFRTYCSPLFLCTIVGFFYSFADYWLLQKFGGAVQQGFYAIGLRFSALSLIATTSMLQVFWKEIAEAHAVGDLEKVGRLYLKVSRTLFFWGAFISCIIIPFSEEIILLFLGKSYQGACLPFALMFLYPVHQSIGQITGAVLLAIGKTRAQNYIGLLFMGISIPATYFVLAPNSGPFPGMGLGATGLSIKMVVCQIFGVNLSAYYIAKYIRAKFDWMYQFYSLLILLLLGFMCKYLIVGIYKLTPFYDNNVWLLAGSAFLYAACGILLLFLFPSIAGFDRHQVDNGLLMIRGFIQKTLLSKIN